MTTSQVTILIVEDNKQAALAAGFDDYISKPIDTKTFSQTVARALASAA